MKRKSRRRVVGVVTSDRMQKTVTVEITRLVKHPLYGKYLRRRTRVMAHDEEQGAHTGDRVELVETRRLSKRKCWRVLQVLARGVVVTPVPGLEDVEALARSASEKSTAPPAAPAGPAETKES